MLQLAEGGAGCRSTQLHHPFAVISLSAWREAVWDLRDVRWYRSTADAGEEANAPTNIPFMSSRSRSATSSMAHTLGAQTACDGEAAAPDLFGETKLAQGLIR
jgi:hypothetical protein